MNYTTHTQYRILLNHKKKGSPLFATVWMDFEGIMLCDRSQRNTNTV